MVTRPNQVKEERLANAKELQISSGLVISGIRNEFIVREMLKTEEGKRALSTTKGSSGDLTLLHIVVGIHKASFVFELTRIPEVLELLENTKTLGGYSALDLAIAAHPSIEVELAEIRHPFTAAKKSPMPKPKSAALKVRGSVFAYLRTDGNLGKRPH